MAPKNRKSLPPESGLTPQELSNTLEARQAELDLLKGIQDGLASGLDIDSIFEQAGERIVPLFPGKGVALYTYDPVENMGDAKFILEDGVRHNPPPFTAGPIALKAMATNKTLMISTRAEFDELGAITVPGTAPSLSGIYTPLIVNDVPVGALNIESTTAEHAFDDSDILLVSTIAGSLSVALENARLFDEAQQSNKELREALEQQSATSEILSVMASSQSEIQPVLDAVAENAARLCEADDVQIYRVEGDRLPQVAHFGPLPALQDGESLPLVPGLITGRAVLEQRTIHTHDTEQISPEEFPESYELQKRLKHRTVIVTPLVRERKAMGAIVVRRNEVLPFTDGQIALLATFADQAAIAIENVRLFDETTRLLKETEERNAELSIINTVQRALSAQLDIRGIYEAVGEKLREIFDSQVIAIYSTDLVNRINTTEYAYEKGQLFEPVSVPYNSLHEHLHATGGTYVFNGNFPEFAAQFDDYHASAGELPKSLVGVPIGAKNGADTFFTLTLQDVDGGKLFSDSDVRLLETLANSMSAALENARLFAETQRLLAETEQRAAELQIINSVQEGLAARSDLQGIYDLIGDTLRDLFDAESMYIAIVEQPANVSHYVYFREMGERIMDEPPSAPAGFGGHVYATRKPLLLSDVDAETMREYGSRFMGPQNEENMSRSWMGAPIISGDHALGMVSIRNRRKDFFSESDLRLLITLTNSLGVALENARLFDETQRLLAETEQRAAELQIINSVQEALASKLEMQAIYELVGEKIREIFKADTTFIAFHDAKDNTLIAPYYADKGVTSLLTSRPYGTGLAETIIDSGVPLHMNTAEEMDALGAHHIASPGSTEDLNQSFLGVPIFRNGVPIGAASVQSYKPYAFDRNDLSLLQTLTNSMSVALENARLFDETQRLLEETEHRAAELGTINAVGQALAAEPELEALIQLIGDQICGMFSADIAYVALMDQRSNLIHFPYTFGEQFDTLQLGEGLTSRILQSGEPLLINEEMDRRREEMGVALVGKRALSFLGVPIQIGGRTLGVISVQSTSLEGRFDEQDLSLLHTIAANVGSAIRNAQLYEEVKRQNEYYAAVIENSPAAIVLMDLETHVTGWNPAAEKLFGYTEQEALGRKVDDLVAKHDDLHDEAVRYSRQALTEKSVHLLAQRTRKDGSLVDVEVAGLPVIVDGVQVEFIAIYHDITELQRARKEAEQANQAKSTFLANMSHELRTPLNAIIGFTRIVRRKGEGLLPGKQVDNLDKVLVSADHLLNLINTILDIAKIEAGRMDVKPSSFELPALIDLVLGTSQPLLQNGVRLAADLEDELPSLFTDQEKVKQILLNLLSNAAKFTHAGQITLIIREQGGLAMIDVSDTGIGISADDLQKVFEEFQQADTSTTREYGGTGLGLAISRSLARLLGGDLTATSVVGRGSTFTLTVPIRYGEPAAVEDPGTLEPPALRAAGGLPRILVIDDDANVHDMLKENLGERGFDVIAVKSGEEGVHLARELIPDAITLDIMMPGKDGWQVLHELKSDPATRDIPVILLTIVDKQALGYQLGAADYLVKPLEEDALLEALDRIRQTGRESGLRLLVVDDDPNIAELVRQLLEKSDFQIRDAPNGKSALVAIGEAPPDVILLDLMMPTMDGFAFIEALRERGLQIPIIVLTAKTLSEADLQALEGSVERVIKKNGLDPERLMRELVESMEQFGGRITAG